MQKEKKNKIYLLSLLVAMTIMPLTVIAKGNEEQSKYYITLEDYGKIRQTVGGAMDNLHTKMQKIDEKILHTYMTTKDLGASSGAFANRIIELMIEPGNADWGDTQLAMGGFTAFLWDAIWPVGAYAFGKKPTIGVWEEVTGDRALWIANTMSDGSTIAQALPKPTVSATSTQVNNHTHGVGSYDIIGEISSSGAGVPWPGVDRSGAFALSKAGTQRQDQWYTNNIDRVSKILFSAYKDHSFTGESASAGKHSHTVTVSVATSGPYGGTKVQPPAYVMKVWKRTA